MLSNAKNVLLAVVLWLVAKPARTVALVVLFGLVTILALSVVLAPEAAVAISASAGSP